MDTPVAADDGTGQYNDDGSLIDRSTLVVEGLRSHDPVLLRQTLQGGIRQGEKGDSIIILTCRRLTLEGVVKLFTYLANILLTNPNIRDMWVTRWLRGLFKTKLNALKMQMRVNRSLSMLYLRVISLLSECSRAIQTLPKARGDIEYWSRFLERKIATYNEYSNLIESTKDPIIVVHEL
eukprot:GHVH01012108.1.p1 GENE.GHVH01012108.1~~GHVH01012108.1.p1  ORF type:complete len:179 (-),score=13.35 GHVH01012108.1:233-769(-)